MGVGRDGGGSAGAVAGLEDLRGPRALDGASAEAEEGGRVPLTGRGQPRARARSGEGKILSQRLPHPFKAIGSGVGRVVIRTEKMVIRGGALARLTRPGADLDQGGGSVIYKHFSHAARTCAADRNMRVSVYVSSMRCALN